MAIRILTESEAKEEKLAKQLKSARYFTVSLIFIFFYILMSIDSYDQKINEWMNNVIDRWMND